MVPTLTDSSHNMNRIEFGRVTAPGHQQHSLDIDPPPFETYGSRYFLIGWGVLLGTTANFPLSCVLPNQQTDQAPSPPWALYLAR